jgi:c-di-GMP-binding flagellar brake protein YcgR
LGRYGPDGSSSPAWSRCRVLDVSIGGAGLELVGPGASAGAGDRIVVDLQLVRTNTARVTLTGEVRHVTPIDDGVRVGLHFVDVGELEEALLARLVARQKHERRRPGVVVPFGASRAFD